MAINNKNIDKVIKILNHELRDLPDPSVTLVGKRWKSPFLVLISCILSLRTKDETTLPASEKLFKAADTPESMLQLTTKRIEELVYPVCFYRNKAKTIHGICHDIINNFAGKVPGTIDELLTMKGVGRKTANLVMTEGFRIPAICVDTHVHRISNRFGYVSTVTPDDTEFALRDDLPKKYWIDYNAMLVVWGQNICRPISPKCSLCGLNKICARNGVEKSR
ncbi:MAG: endonuclease-3 [Lysobacterales bacterium]|jgi:endonuclease-3